MKRDYESTAMAVALTTAEELDRLLERRTPERVVEDDYEQVTWIVHEAVMLKHWADVVTNETPNRTQDAQELILFAIHAQMTVIGDVL